MERRRRIFFLLLHILRLDRFSSLENLCPPRQELIYQEKKKKYSTSLLQKIFAHPDTSLSINSRRRNILLLFSRKSLPTQTRAPPSTEEEEIFYFSSLENLCPPRHELIHQQKQKKYCTSFLHLQDSGGFSLVNLCPPRPKRIHQQKKKNIILDQKKQNYFSASSKKGGLLKLSPLLVASVERHILGHWL